MLLDRIVSLCVLMASLVVPIDAVAFFQKREFQLIAAVLVVAITVFYDAISGLLLGLTLIVIYYRLHWKYLTFYKDTGDAATRMGGPMVSLVRQYISPEHLDSAQNNIVSDKDARVEMVGIQGVYGEDVYGAQGMYNGMPGLERAVGSPV